MKHFKGRQILLLGLVALVIVAGYYRWTLESNGDTAPAMADTIPSDEGDNAIPVSAEGQIINTENPAKDSGVEYFAQSRQSRDMARSESIETMKSAMSDSDLDKTAKEQVQSKMTMAAQNATKESTIESLVKSKGFQDCFVTVDESGVNVVVKGNALEKDNVAQIKDIVISQTGVKAAKIRISNAQ